jgi:hypothetical protein
MCHACSDSTFTTAISLVSKPPFLLCSLTANMTNFTSDGGGDLVFCDYDITPQKPSSVRFAIPQDEEVHVHSQPLNKATNEQDFAAHQQVSPRRIPSPRSIQSPRGMAVQQHMQTMTANGMTAQPRNVVIIQNSAQQQNMSPRSVAHAAQMHRAPDQGANGWQEMLSPRMAGGPVHVVQANVLQNRDVNRIMSQDGSASPRYMHILACFSLQSCFHACSSACFQPCFVLVVEYIARATGEPLGGRWFYYQPRCSCKTTFLVWHIPYLLCKMAF